MAAEVTTWQWVGNFLEINNSYQSGGAWVTELRKEGTRQRVLKGAGMGYGAQAGTAGESSVTAYNGTQASALTPVDVVGQFLDCVEEIYTPVEDGSVPFFIHTQKWTSFYVT